jgi:hypothetical protein
MKNKDQGKAKATFIERSPRHNPATTPGHPEAIEPKLGEVISYVKKIFL